MADDEPVFLTTARRAAMQRPRTQLGPRVRWAYLQQLLGEYDYLTSHADDRTLTEIAKMREVDYTRHANP
jgi:hypothetical protein